MDEKTEDPSVSFALEPSGLNVAMRTGRLTRMARRKAGSPSAVSFFMVDVVMKLKARSPQPRSHRPAPPPPPSPVLGTRLTSWPQTAAHGPPDRSGTWASQAPARAPSPPPRTPAASPSHGAQTVWLFQRRSRVLSESPPPRPWINECACAWPPRGSPSRTQTGVAGSFPREGQRGP